MAQAKQFKLPDVGEGLTEAEIIAWRVSVGDKVALNDILVEVETAKAVVELPSPFAGVVASIRFEAGQTVDVGAVIIDISDDSAEIDDFTPDDPPEVQPSFEVEEKHEVLVGYGPTKANVARRPRRQLSKSATPLVPGGDTLLDRPRATPPVRKLARDLGLDMREVKGTGPHGRVTRSDVTGTPPAAVAQVESLVTSRETRTPIKGVRKVTAEAMVRSAFTAPHVTEWVTVDVTRTVKLVDKLRHHPDYEGVRVSPLVVVAKAALLALRRYPAINSKWDAASGDIVQYADVNLGIAAATPRGLLVPNVRSAQDLSITELAVGVADLVAEARAGKTQLDRMKDGTFTITNIGVFHVDGGTPILNPGEAAILCVGQIRRQPWEHKGKIKLRSAMTIALSFDHRVVDGELGSRVLADIAATLNDPLLALSTSPHARR